MLVRHKKNSLVFRQRLDDFDRVSACAAIIAFGLYLSRAVDVADHQRIGIFLLEPAQLFGVNHIGHRTTGGLLRQEHGFFRRENRRGLRHKPHAAEHDHICISFRRLDAQTQRVARKIGKVLYLAGLVVVGEYHGASPGF